MERLNIGRRVALVLALAGTLLAGCHASDSPSDGKTHIRFSGYVSSPAETDLMKKLVADFNASHTDISVSYEPVPGQYVPKILTMLVSKTAPDVFYLDIAAFKPLLSKHVLRPLDDFMAHSATKKEAFIPSLMSAFSAEGHVYGIPKDFNTLALFYNKAMFDKAHLSYPDASWDLGKFREAAKRLTVNEGGQARYGFALTHDNIDRYLPIANMFGASLFNADGSCGLAGPQALEGMTYYAGLKLGAHAAIYPSEVGSSWTGDAFGRQDVAMAWEGGWLIPYMKETFPGVNYGVAELPHGPSGRSNFLFTVSYVVPQCSKHADAAWKLIEFLTSEASQAQVTFAVPSRTAISRRYAEKHPEYKAILAGAAYARPYDFGPKGDRVKDRLGVAVQEIFLGAKGPEKALSDAAAEIDQINKL